MAYLRKTIDRARLSSGCLRRRAALVAAGMKERELDILYLHDIKQLTFAAIGAKFGFTGCRAYQIFHRGYRKLFSPRRREIAFPKSSRRTK